MRLTKKRIERIEEIEGVLEKTFEGHEDKILTAFAYFIAEHEWFAERIEEKAKTINKIMSGSLTQI